MIAILAFAIIGHLQRRVLLLWVIAWLATGIARYGLIVLSAGNVAMLNRETVRWVIRSLVYVEAGLFAASAIAFIAENVTWKRTRPNEGQP